MASFNSLVKLCWALALCFATAVQASQRAQHALPRKHGYQLVEHYHPHNFFDKFRFFDHPDPTNGFVQYVDRHTANKTGLIRAHKNHTYVGVDHTNVYDLEGPGRPSVRLESHKAYTHGLFILSLNHMPHGCGTWPAYWTLGPHWPYTGEIDIIEGVNNNNYNLMSLHTSQGCSIAGDDQVGKLVTSDCDSLRENVGCGVLHNATKSYGKGFNQNGGGVYAMEWTANFIRIWKWGHKHVPKSVMKGEPKPEEDFGKPDANLAGSCNIDRHFKENYIVFDNTFCGDFAGAQYGGTQCPLAARGQTGCNEFVAKYPEAFTKAYWSINHLKVYQNNDSSVTVYRPKSYSSVIPVASATPSIVSSLLPPGNGHNTTANHAPTSLKLHLSNAAPTTTRSRHSLSTSNAAPTHTTARTSRSLSISTALPPRTSNRPSPTTSDTRSGRESKTSSHSSERVPASKTTSEFSRTLTRKASSETSHHANQSIPTSSASRSVESASHRPHEDDRQFSQCLAHKEAEQHQHKSQHHHNQQQQHQGHTEGQKSHEN